MKTWQDARGIVGAMISASLTLALAQPAAAWDDPQWVRQLGTTDIAEASAVAVGEQDSVYVAGSTTGAFDDCNRTNDNDDAWIAKYSAAGAPIWNRRIGTAAVDSAAGVASDRKGAVYVAGSTQGSLGGPFRGGFDAWVARYSATGELRWKRQLGTPGLDIAWGAAADGDSNVYVAGWTSGSLGGPFQGGDSDAWVAKYSPTGTLLWLRQLGTPETEQAVAVSTDDSGNVFVAGSTASPTSSDGGDAWVAKYSPAGRLLWTRRLGTGAFDTALGVAAVVDGSVYVAGNTLGSLAGPNRGDFDAWVARYTATGTLLWKRQLGTARTDGANAVAADAEGNVYLSGSTAGALGGPSRGSDDAWIAKYARNGALRWKRQLGSTDDDNALGIATDRAGHVYLGGTTMGSLGGPARGAIDAWVAKYSTSR